MLGQRMLMAAAGGGEPYIVDAVNFDGSNDYGSLATLTGQVNTDQISLVASIDFTGGDGLEMNLLSGKESGSLRFNLLKGFDNKLVVSGRNTGGGTHLVLKSTTTYTASDGWKIFLFSKNGTTLNLYEGDTDIADTPATNTAGDIGIGDVTAWKFGADADGGGPRKIDANLADFIFDTNYVDFSVEANRRKAVDADGKPVNVGADGSLLTGSTPLIFLSRLVGASAASYLANKGAGGGFTENGALTNSTNGSPTD